MRDLDQPPAGEGDPAHVSDAEQDAAAAARRARVVIHPVGTVAGLRRVAALFSEVWDAPEVAPMPHDLMCSLADAGGCVHAAYREDTLLGAAVAVFGPPAEASCYSLITGVSQEAQSRGTGLALKLAQRAWALRSGATHMRWTYDPLVRRNAHFNLTRLGATVTEYLVDFYGEIRDGLNDAETDRVAVAWDLYATLPALPGPAAPGAGSAPAVLSAGPGGEPSLAAPAAGQWGGAPGRVTCWIPDDILSMRRNDPALARRWRLAMRGCLRGAIREGYRVTGLAAPGWYVLERERAAG